MNVVLYLRYSSDRQTEQSIEGQRRICEQYCQAKGMKIIKEYADRALSASKDTNKREAFQRMIEDSDKGEFGAVVVYKLDRFSRDRYDSAIYKNKLKKNGVRIISATEPISDTPEGILMESILEGFAEYYSKELAQKVTRGMRETAMKGNSCGGVPPFGYKIENKKFVIDPVKGPILQEIFKRYIEGEACADIAEDLNTRGIKTSLGREFNKSSFASILKNQKYIGILKYNDIVLENEIPALIDKETFDLAQAKLKEKKHAPAKKIGEKEFLLSSKAFCGHCESPMIGDSGTGKNGNTYYYYTCAGKKQKRSCDKKSIGKDELEDGVIKDILDFLTPENIQLVADTAEREYIRQTTMSCSLEVLERIKELDKSIDAVMKIAEKSSNPERYTKRLDELYNERDLAAEYINTERQKAIYIERDKITFWLSDAIAKHKGETNFQKYLINTLVNSVTVWDEPDGYRLTIVYNLSSKNPRTVKLSTLNKDGPPNNKETHVSASPCCLADLIKGSRTQ